MKLKFGSSDWTRTSSVLLSIDGIVKTTQLFTNILPSLLFSYDKNVN